MKWNDLKTPWWLTLGMIAPALTLGDAVDVKSFPANRAYGSPGGPSNPPNKERPNIIFFLTDDQGAGDAGVLGHPYMKTPNIDRLAAEGTIFNQFYITSPVCSPSRVTFMTGRFPAELGVHHIFSNRQRTEEWQTALYMPVVPTVTSLLKTAGYTTGHFGKWHLTSGGADMPAVPSARDYGIDEIKIGTTWGAMEAPRFDTSDPYYRAHSTGMFVDAAIDFIERNKEQPFFVNIWTLVPHAELKPTPEELAVYEGLTVSPDDFEGYMREYLERAPDAQSQMKVYCAAMTGLDKAFGRLLDYLDEAGLAEDTIILYSSDNGPEDYAIGRARNAGVGSADVHRARKRSIYEGGTRVPFIVRWPGRVPAGRVDTDSVLCAVDFLPTLASLAGVSLEKMEATDHNGEDVSAALTGSTHVRSRPLFWEWKWDVRGDPLYRPPSLAIREGAWKLFCEPDGSDVELYNIPQDPEERHNVFRNHPEVADRLQANLLEWKNRIPEGPLVEY